MKEIDFRDVSQMEQLKDALSGERESPQDKSMNLLFSIEQGLVEGLITPDIVRQLADKIENEETGDVL